MNYIHGWLRGEGYFGTIFLVVWRRARGVAFFYIERKNEYQLHSTWIKKNTTFHDRLFFFGAPESGSASSRRAVEGRQFSRFVSPFLGLRRRICMAVHVTLLWRPSLGTDKPGLGSGEEKGGGRYIPTYDGDVHDGVGDIQFFRVPR